MTSLNDLTSAGADLVHDLGAQAGDAAQKASAQTQKALHQTRKNLKQIQHTAQENVASGLSNMRDRWDDGSQHARESLVSMGSHLQDRRERAEEHHRQAQRRRARARTLFRWGILIGLIVAFLYTPVPGSEVRRRIAQRWRQYTSPEYVQEPLL